MYRFNILIFFALISCNSSTNTEKKNLTQIDTENTIWSPASSKFKRMFYGKVKSSEEIVYGLYTNGQVDGPLGRFIYYKKVALGFPINFEVEFDSLGKKTSYLQYVNSANDNFKAKAGFSYHYNHLKKLMEIKRLSYDNGGLVPTSSKINNYDSKGLLNYQIICEYNSYGEIEFISDSINYKYNSKNLQIDTQYFHAEQYEGDDELNLEVDFGEYPIEYEFDSNGNITKKTKNSNEITLNTYKNNFLHKSIETFHGKTDELFFYPNGVIKIAKIRASVMPGDYEFNETGDMITKNGRKVGRYTEYDEHGNWTKRMLYKENGEPHSYTERIIEYYK